MIGGGKGSITLPGVSQPASRDSETSVKAAASVVLVNIMTTGSLATFAGPSTASIGDHRWQYAVTPSAIVEAR
jgi:hypothetical protein